MHKSSRILRFKNNHNNVELVILQARLKQLETYGKKHYPNEFGGFLIGYYSADLKSLTVTEYLLPVRYKGQHCLFERSIKGVRHTFRQLFDTKRQFYVGEWHTHPDGSTAFSPTDLSAMMQIANCETVNITNPILLILSVDQNGISNYAFYLYNEGALIKYEKY